MDFNFCFKRKKISVIVIDFITVGCCNCCFGIGLKMLMISPFSYVEIPKDCSGYREASTNRPTAPMAASDDNVVAEMSRNKDQLIETLMPTWVSNII